MVEELKLAHLPSELTLYIAGFRDVKNAAYLREQLLAANQAFNYAFLDASAVLSRRQLLTAAFRAMNDYIHDRLRSNNVQSEVVFCLNPNNNIGDAFRRFGISDTSTDIVVIKVGDIETDQVPFTKQSIDLHLNESVEGSRVEVTDEWLEQVCDLDKVRKTYKVAKPQLPKGAKVNGESKINERADIEVQVLGAMALRGAT